MQLYLKPEGFLQELEGSSKEAEGFLQSVLGFNDEGSIKLLPDKYILVTV